MNRKAPPSRPDATEDEARIRDSGYVPESLGPTLKDPRSRAAIDNIGVDDQADLLDVELDDQPGDDARGSSFLDGVRSDRFDDERSERR